MQSHCTNYCCTNTTLPDFVPWNFSEASNAFTNKVFKWRKFNGEIYREKLGQIVGKDSNDTDVPPPIRHGRLLPAVWQYDLLEWHNCAVTSSIVVRKSLLYQVGKFDVHIKSGQDWDLWLRVLRLPNIRLGYYSEPTVVYDGCHGDDPAWEQREFLDWKVQRDDTRRLSGK